MTKNCKKCNSEQPVDQFYTGRPECKSCTKLKAKIVRDRIGKEAIREKNKAYWAKNKESLKAKNKEYYEQHREACKESMRKYYRNNKSAFLAYNSKRRATQMKATPSWVDAEELKYIAKLAQDRGLEIDHIIPLTHPKVCGLHVPANLRCINKQWNMWKSNRLIGEQYADIQN